MLFKRAFYPGLVDGSITLTFRLWKRPQVKLGGRYRLATDGALEVDALTIVRPAEITDAEARRSGFSDCHALLEELARSAGQALRPTSSVTRVAFHYRRSPDERAKRAVDARRSPEDVQALSAGLERMDAASRHGPWTRGVLSIIERRPRVAASRLARRLGRETLAFKADVRKLKNLGLTLSFDVGYDISPRGRAFLRAR